MLTEQVLLPTKLSSQPFKVGHRLSNEIGMSSLVAHPGHPVAGKVGRESP